MTNKKAILSLVAIFAALFLISFASAASLTASLVSAPSATAHNAGSFSVAFNVTNSGEAASLTFENSAITSGSGTISIANTSILNGSATPVTLSLIATVNFPAHQTGNIAGIIWINPSGGGNSKNVTFTVPITSSSTLDVTSSQSLTKTQGGIINVTNTGNANLANIALSASGAFNVSLSPSSISNLAAGSSTLVNVASLVNLSDRSITNLGPNTVTILAKDTITNVSDTLDYTVYEDFCDYDNINTSKVDIISIEDKTSSTEWEWKPLDDVTVDVEVENNMGDDEDFVVEIALWDSEKHKFIELNDESSLTEDVSINEDDSEKVSFDFQVPIELEDSDGRYVLYVKAYVDGKEKTYCNSYAAYDISDGGGDISIEKKEKDVSLGEVTFPETARAGETVTITARAFNIGSSDQDKVMVGLSNTKLGLDLESSSFSLDSGDSNLVDFSFVIPTTAENGIYTLKLFAYYDYKKASDYYAKDEGYDVKITVGGGVNITTGTSLLSGISASLESDAKAGSDLEITTTITNLGATQATFVVSALDYESWATLNSISDRTITLAAGASKDITISLKVNEDVSGEQTFKIESRSGTKIDSKTVAVEISGESWLSSLTSSFGDSTTLWIVGAVNVVLIALIIFLAIKVFRR